MDKGLDFCENEKIVLYKLGHHLYYLDFYLLCSANDDQFINSMNWYESK
jgi:hypothetical protein